MGSSAFSYAASFLPNIGYNCNMTNTDLRVLSYYKTIKFIPLFTITYGTRSPSLGAEPGSRLPMYIWIIHFIFLIQSR